MADDAEDGLEARPAACQIAISGHDQTTANRRHCISVGSVCADVVPSARLVFEERRNEVADLGSELQHPSVSHDLDRLGHSIDGVCRALLSVCLGHCKDLALTTAASASAAASAIRAVWTVALLP